MSMPNIWAAIRSSGLMKAEMPRPPPTRCVRSSSAPASGSNSDMPVLQNFRNDCIRRAVAGSAVAWALLLPSVVGAQTLGAVEYRLDRLEKSVRQIEEHQADRRTRSTNADDAYLQLN